MIISLLIDIISKKTFYSKNINKIYKIVYYIFFINIFFILLSFKIYADYSESQELN